MTLSNIDKLRFFDEIGYSPHSGQLHYHTSDARFRVAVCGRRYGKSTMSARDLQPKLFQPRKWFWIAGPTYDLGEKEFRVIWDDLMIGKGLLNDKRIKRAYNVKGGTMYLEFPWRTRLEVRSAQHPESLVGEGLDGVIMAEAAKHKRETWDRYIRPALADKRGFGDFTTTPEGQNWLYTMWRLGQNPDFPEYESWRMPSWENDRVYPGGRTDPEILLLERTLSEEDFAQEIAASFTAFKGKIYSEWDESLHVKKIEFNPEWPNYIAWDWGFVNPLAAIEFQVDPQDNIYIWREHYDSYKRLDEHFQIMRDRPQPAGYRIDNTFGDAADPEAVARVNEHFGPCIALPEAKENWRDGIMEVKKFLKPQHTGDNYEDGTPVMEPKLWVDHSCANTIHEFGNYKGKIGSTSTKNPLDPADKPQKVNDHAMDAIRYGIMHIFRFGAIYSLADTMNITPVEPGGGYEPEEALVRSVAGSGGTFNMNMEF